MIAVLFDDLDWQLVTGMRRMEIVRTNARDYSTSVALTPEGMWRGLCEGDENHEDAISAW